MNSLRSTINGALILSTSIATGAVMTAPIAAVLTGHAHDPATRRAPQGRRAPPAPLTQPITTERLFWHCGAHTAKPKNGVWTPILPIPYTIISSISNKTCWHVGGEGHAM